MPFHSVRGVLKARILKWFAIPFSSGPHSVKSLHRDPPVYDGCTKRSREEPPHGRGQGQKPGGPLARRAVAKRSYPTSEVRGSSREYQTATAQEWPRGATRVRGQGQRREELSRVRGQGQRRGGDTPCPKPKARGGGQEEQPHARGQGRWPGGPTPLPRSRGCAGAGGPRGAIPH